MIRSAASKLFGVDQMRFGKKPKPKKAVKKSGSVKKKPSKPVQKKYRY